MKNNEFRKRIFESNKQKTRGKLIIISGMSGSGKNVVADIFKDEHKYVFIDKYVTRPFRKVEIEEIKKGKNIGIKPVLGQYNDGEKNGKEQKECSAIRKNAFVKLRLPIAYVNYDEYYGFSVDEINSYIENGRNVAVIINDPGAIQDLKDIYSENSIACYIHRAIPKNKEIFMEFAKQRGDTIESAEKRYQKALKDFDRYTNNLNLYDCVILNTEKGTEKLSKLIDDLDRREFKGKQEEKNKKQGKAKIYVFIGNPGSGKDEALETIRVQGILHSIIMPKYTDRKRNQNDGEEMICLEDGRFNMNSRYIQYINFGNKYVIDVKELEERLNDGISSSIVISNKEAIQKLKEIFPEEVVTIYMQGLSLEEYKIQQKDHLDEEYVQKRIKEYGKADELYYNQWFDMDHVIINNGDLGDLKVQLNTIMRYYEEGRSLSLEEYKKYMSKAMKYIQKMEQRKKDEGEQSL